MLLLSDSFEVSNPYYHLNIHESGRINLYNILTFEYGEKTVQRLVAAKQPPVKLESSRLIAQTHCDMFRQNCLKL